MAADLVVHRVPRLVQLVDEGGEALRAEEDPQGEPLTTYYQSPLQGGVIVDERCLALDLSESDEGTMTISLANGDDWLNDVPHNPPDGWCPSTGQGLLLTLRDPSGRELLTGTPMAALGARFTSPVVGRWVFIPEPLYAESAQELWDAAMEASQSLHRWATSTHGRQIVGICTKEEIAQGVYEPAWVFMTRRVELKEANRKKGQGHPANRGPKRRETDPVFVRALRWANEDLAARIPELAPMRKATVAVFGLGSLGAPFVQEMAKSRVGALHLADFDHIDAGTSVRYPLGLDNAGLGKCFGVSRWVQLHNPEVRVEAISLQVGSAPIAKSAISERDLLHRLLNGAGLVVGATAEHDVNRQLDELGIEYGIPRLYMWSQSGYGGVVALLQKGKTGCFHCLSLLLSRRAEEGHPVVAVPPDHNGQPAGTIQGRGCADKTFTAANADLLPIAVHAARVAYGHLCESSDGGYPAFKGDVFAVQLREPTGEPIPPVWTTFDLPSDPACPICSAA